MRFPLSLLILPLLIAFCSPAATALASEVLVDKLKLLNLLRNGDFEELESRLTRLQQEAEANDGQDYWVGAAFFTFGADDPRLLERIEEWIAASPGSFVPRLVMAFHQWGLGWASRGGAYARNTSEEQFSAMRRHFATAREDARAALKINPRLGIAYSILISMTSGGGRSAEERETLESGLDAAPRSFQIRWQFLYGLQPQWGGSVEMLEAFAEASVRPFPQDALLQTLRGYPDWYRGKRLHRQGKYEEALARFDKALEYGPYWHYLISRAEALGRLGRDAEALDSYAQAEALRPQEPSLFKSRGWWQFKRGRLVEALEDLTLAIDLDPLDYIYLTNRSMILRDLKRNDLALADLDQALIRGSNNPWVHRTRGRLLLQQLQDPEAARTDLKRATELDPEDINNWYFYGQALYTLKDCEFVPALQKFEELCDAGATCSRESRTWARDVVKFVMGDGLCPK